MTSSFDKGRSDGVAARLTKPASTSRIPPITIFFAKVEFDFILDYPHDGRTSHSFGAPLLIEPFPPPKVVWQASQPRRSAGVIIAYRPYC